MNYLQKQVLDFINKYPKQAHILALVLIAAVSIFDESKTAHALVLQAVNHIPHGSTLAGVIGSCILFYTQHEK